MTKKIRKKSPRVAVLLESSHGVSRNMIRGIIEYVRLYGPWGIDIVSGGAGDQRLPDRKFWKGDGIIGRIPNSAVADEVVATKLPTVVIDPVDEFLDPAHPLSTKHSVRCDSPTVGRVAAEYFMNRKYEHFAFVGEPTNINWSRSRRQAFAAGLDEFGYYCHAYPGPGRKPVEWDIERKKMVAWLKRLPIPIALFAANDQRARQVLDACMAASLSVPYQVAVLGVNNDHLICETTLPTLSSISLESRKAGFEAARILDRLMRRERFKPHPIFFKPGEIVSRDSTGAVRVEDKAVMRILEFIRMNGGRNIRVADVAHHLGTSRQWAERAFKKVIGRSIMDEIKMVRMRTIRGLVVQTDLEFQEIAAHCGFECANHLGIIFKNEYGMTMGEFRQRHRSGSGDKSSEA